MLYIINSKGVTAIGKSAFTAMSISYFQAYEGMDHVGCSHNVLSIIHSNLLALPCPEECPSPQLEQ